MDKVLYDEQGRFLVRGIFWELSNPDRRQVYPPSYTLKVEDAHGLPSAYNLYMNSVDEYEAAIKIAGNMNNWRKLCNCAWFMEGMVEYGHDGLRQWRLDMEARDKSIAKKQLQEKALEGSVQAMTKLYNIGEKKILPKKPVSKLKQKSESNVLDLANKINR